MRALRVIPVAADDLDRFLDVPRAVEGGQPDFVAPLREAERRDVAGAAAPGGAVQAFLCEVDGRAVGRVAALLQPRLRGAGGVPMGQLGFYACREDEAASAALFDAALGWLRARGCREALGPIDGGVHRRHRLMTHGFERTPFLLEPRNPRWYPGQFLAAGFRPAHRWRSYDVPRDALPPLRDALAAVARRRGAAFEVEYLDPRDAPAALARVHALLDAVWSGHPGWAPFPASELAETFGALLPLLPPRHLAVLRDRAGRDVGLGFMFPDWAEEVRALDGDASGWARWMGRARARRVVGHTVAVRPDVRSGGAGAKIISTALSTVLEAGYEALVFALTTATFRLWDHRLEATREYALYHRAL